MGCILSKAEVATTKAEVTTTTKAGGTRVAVTEPPVTPVAVPWYEVAVDLSNPVVRKSAHDLTEAEGDRVVAAWRKMTENKKGVPGSSEYFRLGVVHGGTQDRGTWLSEAQNPTPSYCVHGPECFANWHRIYITDMELTLRRADLALGNDGRIGLPYFDWTVKPAGKPMLPMVLQKIMATDSFEGKFSEGGLFHDTFLPLDRSGNQMAPRERDGTLFYKTTKWSPTLDAELRGLLVPAGLLVATMDVLRQANHRSAARTLESNPHGSVHVAVGMVGNKVPGTEMVGSVPTAGFHPIFWMHHCNVDRVYESCLATDLGKTFEEEFRGRLQGGGGSSPTNAFPGGEWGRFEPFGINPRTGEQYHCRDTFDTVGLGFKYDSLYKLPGTEGSLELMREKPLVCVFRDVEKSCVNGSKALFVYVSGCAEGSWTMPIDLAALDPTQLRALPNYAGFASLFVFSESAKCDNCVHNSPKVDVHLDVTAAVRALCLARAKTTLHVIAYDLCTKACMTLEQAGVPQPILMGPSIENHLAEDTEHTDDVTTLQHLLNDDKEGTPLKVDGKFGPLMTDAVKRAQCAAGLEPTGVFDGQLRSALHNKLSSLWHKVTGEDQPCAPVLVPKAGTVIRWRLVEGSVPPSIGTKAAVAAELAVAFAEWDAAMDGVTFERVVAADDAQMTIRFEDHTPHNKLIFDGPGGALAAVTPDTITFDSAERWELMDCKHSQRGCVPDEYFFKLLPVAVHEIGHLFGLGHSSEPGDVMSPFYNKVTKLSANDKARVAALLLAAAAASAAPVTVLAPKQASLPSLEEAALKPSLKEAALKLEAGQRDALEKEVEEAAAALQEPEVHQVDLQAWQAKEIDLRRVWVRNHKFDFLLVLAVGGGGGLVVGVVGGALLAILVESFLHAWHAKRLALYRACHVKGLAIPDYRALANKEFLEALLAAGGAVLLAVFLFRFFVAASGEQPAPEPVALECLWRWKAFRCSTGCKPRMHWPGLQGACTPM